jgi:two-component system, sensor histidine kinase and response regulator
MLEKAGVEVVVANDGKEAVRHAQNEPFDLIFMDIHMPNMNGYEATEALRKSGMKVPIVALTANAMKGDDRKCFEAGCDDYLSKPIERKKLFETLVKYLQPAPHVLENIDAVKNQVDELSQSICDASSKHDETIINWSRLMDRTNNDQELRKEIIKIWLEESPLRISALSQAVKAKTVKDIALHAHTIKGSAATIGAETLSKAAFELEIAGKKNQLKDADTMLANMITEFEKVKTYLLQSDGEKNGN